MVWVYVINLSLTQYQNTLNDVRRVGYWVDRLGGW